MIQNVAKEGQISVLDREYPGIGALILLPPTRETRETT
jgi:hypothetical protein